ncbi:MAG: Mo-dependent nitrogenase C-terminal domain-containing protein [Calothrix sp. C42_A2020_038]|nr:Mo-dependent nitrogenase C-terminal domain-containing protein [Calothrix sp. C42_A2020_038]
MKVFGNTAQKIFFASWVSLNHEQPDDKNSGSQNYSSQKPRFDCLKPLRRWVNSIEVGDRKMAHRLCKLIPSQCPFERDVNLFGKTLFHIPPMCKLNPLYNELVGLRFRALCYLADQCGEDVSQYC